MKKLLFIALCLVSIASTAQEYPIYSPVRIYGTLMLDPFTNLPTGVQMQLANHNDTLWIKHSGSWKPIYPSVAYSDTTDVIYLTDKVQFVGGGWVKKYSGGSGVQISPNGSATMYFGANTEPVGVTMGGVQTIIFPTNSVYQDYFQGFTNDTAQHSFDSAFAPSKAAVHKMINAHGGGSGTIRGPVTTPNQAVYVTGADSVAGSTNISIDNDTIRVTNQATGVNEVMGSTSTGALKILKPAQTIQVVVTDTIVVSPDSTGYELSIGSLLHGTNLIDVELFYRESQGNKVPTVTVWRNRSGTEVNMTSTGATFTTDAVINASYDDVVRGDRIRFKTVLGIGDTPPYGMNIQLTFQKP